MSPMMKRFLTSWLAWANAMNAGESTDGMPDYSRHTGLCCNTYEYVSFADDTDVEPDNMPDYWHESQEGDVFSVASDALRDELERMFIADDLRGAFPFGYADYSEGMGKGNMYACPKRLAWVESKLAEV